VGYVKFPSLRDTEKAAAQGIEEAIRDLPEKRKWVKRIETRINRFEREKLKRADQLPELWGEALEFTMDVVSLDGEDYQVIRLGDVEVWRELAFWDHLQRFDEIKNILREKYGRQFKSLMEPRLAHRRPLLPVEGDYLHVVASCSRTVTLVKPGAVISTNIKAWASAKQPAGWPNPTR
jgi:hypothetical protein